MITTLQSNISELPPRQQVDTLIRTWLSSGEYGPGDLLPTATEICRLCDDISKSTVRRSLKILIAEGLLLGVKGKGVYVNTLTPKNRKHMASNL